MIRAVIFDVGYTLIDEARQWSSRAQEMGVTDDAFHAALKAVIAHRKHHREVFARLDPNFDLKAAFARRDASPDEIWTEADLYSDARSALATLQAQGFQIGLAGNQPPAAKCALEGLGLPIDWISNSAELGVEKPSPIFFARVAARAGYRPNQIAYVGDRLDNDVLPAQAAGMRGVFIVRGPWGEAHVNWPDAADAHHTIRSLHELTYLWPDSKPCDDNE